MLNNCIFQKKISENGGIIYIFVNLSIWLDHRYVDSHICFFIHFGMILQFV